MVSKDGPEIVVDEVRLASELESYRNWLEENTEKAYLIAQEARSKGLDFADTVEIPRAADLASRTEKLLEEYLRPTPEEDPIRIEDDLRKLLGKVDRETASIQIAVDVGKRMHKLTADVRRSIDTSGLSQRGINPNPCREM